MLTEDQIEAIARANWPGIEWDDESLAESAHLREAFRAGVRAAIAAHQAKAGPAVPQGIPAQEVIDAIEAWKSAWLKVPPFADRVNKATREAITISHNSLFLLLQSAQQAQRMPAGCTTPTGCGPHGCHGACIAATPAAPSQEPVTLTDEQRQQVFRDAENRMMRDINLSWRNAVVDEVERAIAALREKEGK